MSEKTFLIDVEKCTGCKLCIVACKDEHVGNAYAPWTQPQPDTGHFWVDIKEIERGRTPRVKMNYLAMMCQHCAAAPCITACPEGAIKTRDDGLVWIDPVACTGCGKCQPACPYDVIYMNAEANVAQKCTGCAHRVDEGAQPRCVEVCPHDAIEFHDGGAPAQGGDITVLHPEYNAKPRVLWKGLPKPWIAGTVIDVASDDVAEGVTVTAVDQSDSSQLAVTTDVFGDFWIKGLASGRTYRVDVAKDGFKPVTRTVTTDGDQDLGTIELIKV
jgi:tetrathionate reductase subunit B